MRSSSKNKNTATFAIRWIARILGLVLVFVVISITIQNGIQNLLGLGLANIILNLCLLLMLIGIIIGLKWDTAGGVIIIVGFTSFWIVNIITTGTIRLGWVFPLFPIVGAFFLIYGLRKK